MCHQLLDVEKQPGFPAHRQSIPTITLRPRDCAANYFLMPTFLKKYASICDCRTFKATTLKNVSNA